MPNHVTTIIEFSGKKENIEKIFELIKSDKIEDGSSDVVAIDFNKLIPMPDNIYRGDLGQKERELYGQNNWYDWSTTHWGTKWNAYCVARDDNSLEFDTAWSCPLPILEALAKLCYQYQVEFCGEWADEDIGCNTGWFGSDCQDDEYWFDYNYFDDQSNEAYKAYIRCKGGSDCIGEDENGDYIHYDCDTCPNKDNC